MGLYLLATQDLRLLIRTGVFPIAFIVEGVLVAAGLDIDAVVYAVVRFAEVAVVSGCSIGRFLGFIGFDRVCTYTLLVEDDT
ncbi:MAG: hypothetical protein JWO03_3001 [Bacteroidetes bacterium]|nr:hypothetical protein [Bacteroidota bacterium]